MSGGHDHIEGTNKSIAILIAILAACLAIAETGAKGAQTDVLTEHVEASNLWGFFQAKTIRQSIVRTAAEEVEALYKGGAEMPAAVQAQLESWRRTVARYDSEPDTKEGRKELREGALGHAAKRDKARAAYHHFEYGSAAFQLAIVLASAAAVTSVPLLAVASGVLGLLGAALTAIGFLAPTAIHL
ncbi:MAG: DUF4337 domain-containing protein [Proteobacteria bacterium]|nr:DUF4337 domain-containing protein [Pseudomonadota bacterium]